jgi:hypothetical protein
MLSGLLDHVDRVSNSKHFAPWTGTTSHLEEVKTDLARAIFDIRDVWTTRITTAVIGREHCLIQVLYE